MTRATDAAKDSVYQLQISTQGQEFDGQLFSLDLQEDAMMKALAQEKKELGETMPLFKFNPFTSQLMIDQDGELFTIPSEQIPDYIKE